MRSPGIRAALFLVGCIGSRAALAYAAHAAASPAAPAWALRVMGLGGLAISVAFFAIFFMGWRTTGREVFGDKIWWDDLRPVHAGLYLAFAALALRGRRGAWVPLAIDVTVGLTAFLIQRWSAAAALTCPGCAPS